MVSGRFELNCSVSVSVLVETICMLLSPAVETKISVWSGLNMAATGVVAWAPVNVTGVAFGIGLFYADWLRIAGI